MVRPIVSAFAAIRGARMTQHYKRGASPPVERYVRLLVSSSEVVVSEGPPLPIWGVAPTLSPAVAQTVATAQSAGASCRPASAVGKPRGDERSATTRGFRLVLPTGELELVARSAADKDCWLLALASLPVGAAFLDRLRPSDSAESANARASQTELRRSITATRPRSRTVEA